MISFEEFVKRNLGFDEYASYGIQVPNKVMQKNYAIACEVERVYQQTHGCKDGPRIGDIVEFSDGFQVYGHAKISENMYGGSQYGMLCICEQGTSHTDGKHFSTSGGAFVKKHKSHLQYAGKATNEVWTWGCFGAGANKGIYFPLEVQKWIIPYSPILIASRVQINGKHSRDVYGRSRDAVTIQNSGNVSCNDQHFISIKAFRAWAEYVGYECRTCGRGTFVLESSQRIVRKYVLNREEKPDNGKPLHLINNGRATEAWAVTTSDAITYYILNESRAVYSYDSEETQKEITEFRKYDGNPLGI